jgi:hypothetical protein
MKKVKQVYKITYPTNKIYIGKDSYGSYRYFGSPNMELVSNDFQKLSKEIQMDYTIRKEILWESETATEKELSEKEVEMIRKYQSNNPEIGYNQWPRFKG